MTIWRREAGLLAFALAIVAASLLTETRRDVSAASPLAGEAARAGQSARPRAELAALDVDEWLARLKARGMNAGQSGPGLFGGASWQPQPDPAASLPAKPKTPPFPFVLLGRMTLGDTTVIVLSKGEVTHTAKAGQVVDQFRFDRIGDDDLRVTYMPNGEARDYRYEQLYASVNVARPPGSPMQSAPPMQQPQAVDSPDAQSNSAGAQIQQRAQTSSAPADRPIAGGAASAAAAAGMQPNPIVQGAAAPIGGMVITPVPPGVGMLTLPAPPGGIGMTVMQPTSGIGMQGQSGAPSATTSAPAQK